MRKRGNGSIRKDGYKSIYRNNKSVLEHRYIIEQHFGIKLPPNKYVHHIDGDKLNNHISNLMIVTPGEHMYHHTLTFRSPTHKQCSKCFKTKLRTEFNRQVDARAKIDLHHPWCKQCHYAYAHWHRKNASPNKRCAYCKKPIFRPPCKWKRSRRFFCTVRCKAMSGILIFRK